MRYGIPDFKLDKSVIDRRIAQMEAEGVHFRCGVEVGKTIGVEELRDAFQGVVLAGGSTIARELPIEGRQAQGVHLAMDFLSQQNRVCDGSLAETTISAKGKHVVVLGGGDTGADCVGTSIRQGCASVTQIELMPRPSEDRPESMPWPYWPMILRTSSSHDEGAVREWSIMTKRFISDDAGQVRAISAVKVELVDGKLQEVADSQFEIRADLVFLALGFVSPQKAGLLESLAVNLDARGNVAADKHFKTSVPGVFACGDMRRGQSLVVWAIWGGRQAAAEVDAHLMGRSYLPVMNHTAPLEL